MKTFKELMLEARPRSVVKILSTKELRTLARAFKTMRPEISIQGLDETDVFDKLLMYFLNGRSVGSIPFLRSNTEGAWIVHQLEFDPKFFDTIEGL